jgi:membrane-associated HD superfamily phosphohydrolase
LFRESAIISLADSIESASRSLKRPTPQKIEQMIETIIEQRISDRQLDECDLTLSEIWEIADSFKSTISSMLHRRIAYRDEDEEPATNPLIAAPAAPDRALTSS